MIVRFSCLVRIALASLLSLPTQALADARVKVTINLYCESPPQYQAVKRVIVVHPGGGSAEIKPAENNPYYYRTFVSNLLAKLDAQQGGEATVKVDPADPEEFFILPSQGISFPLVFRESSLFVKCYDKRNYFDYLIDEANGLLRKKNRQAVMECQNILDRIEELELETSITLGRLRTKRLDVLMDADDFQQDDGAVIDEWLEKSCFKLADSQSELVADFVSALVYSAARTRRAGWLDQGATILKRAVAQGIYPKYGAGDLWEALVEAGQFRGAFRVAYGASEHLLTRKDAQNIRWFRRAVTALQRWNSEGGGDDVRGHAAELAALLKHRIELAAAQEQRELRPMLTEIDLLSNNLP